MEHPGAFCVDADQRSVRKYPGLAQLAGFIAAAHSRSEYHLYIPGLHSHASFPVVPDASFGEDIDKLIVRRCDLGRFSYKGPVDKPQQNSVSGPGKLQKNISFYIQSSTDYFLINR